MPIAGLDGAGTFWDVALLLLDLHGALGKPRPNDQLGDPYSPWAQGTTQYRRYFEQRDGLLIAEDRRQIEEWTSGGTDADQIYAVLWALDIEGWPTFAPSWRDRLPLKNGRYELLGGDRFPVTDVELGLLAGGRASTRPSSTRPLNAGELPHIRIFDPPAYKVVIDFTFEREAISILRHLATLATVHPNLSINEFTNAAAPLRFPIAVIDEPTQQARVLGAVETAIESGAQIVVAPELASSRNLAAQVQALLLSRYRTNDVLVVPGSWHELDTDGKPRNITCGIIGGRQGRLEHTKIVPYRDELSGNEPSREAIEPGEQLVVYAAGQWRLALLICRDFLDRDLSSLVADLGVNVLCIPALSGKTAPFDARIRPYVLDTQGFVVVSNGPFEHVHGQVRPAALFGQPLEGATCVTWEQPNDPSVPAVVVHAVGETAANVVA